MKHNEDCTIADPFYMQNCQHKIGEQERAKLVNKIFYVCRQFQLRDETLQLTINLIDRYLSNVLVDNVEELQLIAASALLICTKYEEIYPPTGRELLHCMCKTSSKDEYENYTHADLLKLESEMLSVVEFMICETTPLCFLSRYVIVAKSTDQTRYIAQYYLELALLDSKMNQYPPSLLAASALYAAMRCVVNDKN